MPLKTVALRVSFSSGNTARSVKMPSWAAKLTAVVRSVPGLRVARASNLVKDTLKHPS